MNAAENPKFLPRETCVRIASQLMQQAEGGGETYVSIRTWWRGSVRWARNRVVLSSEQRNHLISVKRVIQGAEGWMFTNQFDDVSLQAVVRAAERVVRLGSTRPPDMPDSRTEFSYAEPVIWSDRTAAQTIGERGEFARSYIEGAEKDGKVSAGYIAVQGGASAHIGWDGLILYAPTTDAQCSMTVRDARGLGSGWAGLSSYDWGTIDGPSLAARALEKCQQSMNPVRIEPGRYTTILEPQAVADLLIPLLSGSAFDRITAEAGGGPFAASRGMSKLGQTVADSRVTILHDPMDPQLGVVPFAGDEPVRAVKWIDQGVLMNLAHDRNYALTKLNENLGYPNTMAFKMLGGTATIEEMIRTTKRGLLVTRLWNPYILDETSALYTGVTRDGLWLIENGKISKSVYNFRFTESPIFMLNRIEALGHPVPVFRPGIPVVVPPLKVNDFSFTSLVDAI